MLVKSRRWQGPSLPNNTDLLNNIQILLTKIFASDALMLNIVVQNVRRLSSYLIIMILGLDRVVDKVRLLTDREVGQINLCRRVGSNNIVIQVVVTSISYSYHSLYILIIKSTLFNDSMT